MTEQRPQAPAGAMSWGRVDADGTVYVRTATGERAVGAFPDVPAEQALALFVRKYDDLAAQVDLLAQRVATGRVSPTDGTASVDRLRSAIVDAAAVGDLDALARRLDEVAALVQARRVDEQAARARAREAAREAKEALVAEAEALADDDRWKTAGDRLRTLVEEWKAAPRLDRHTDDELWTRFRAARATFDRRRRAHFAEQEAAEQEVATRKEQIAREAETLATSAEWGPTAGRFRELMAAWKSAGRASRTDEARLWERFRSAQDTFFAARNEVFASRDAEQRENLAAKEALVTEAEALLPVTDLPTARALLRSIQDRWDQIGHVPRDDMERIEGRLRRVEQEVRAFGDKEWRRTDPAAQARAQDTVAALERSVGDLERQARDAAAQGNSKAATEAEEALAARRSWLEEARRTLADLSR